MTLTALLLCALLSQSEVIGLDNGTIRVEMDLDLFSVRFIGLSGGGNFVAPSYVEFRDRIGEGWTDGGGLRTEIHPGFIEDPALSRGPAKVIEQSRLHAVLLGVRSAESGIQLQKEIRLDPVEGRAWYTVTALSDSSESMPISIHSTASIPQGTLLILRPAAEVFPLAKSHGTLEEIMQMDEGEVRLSIRAPVSSGMVTLEAGVNEVTFVRGRAHWTRNLLAGEEEEFPGPAGPSFRCPIDDTAKRYSATFMTPVQSIDGAAPVVLRELWIFGQFAPPSRPDEPESDDRPASDEP